MQNDRLLDKLFLKYTFSKNKISQFSGLDHGEGSQEIPDHGLMRSLWTLPIFQVGLKFAGK